MFTGLVQHVGVVRRAERAATGVRLTVDPAGWTHRPAPGDSIAVNGCCLTVVRADDALAFDVVPETLSRTTLAAWSPGRRVNLEHAATPTTLLGGHLVQGHIDGVGRVVSNADAGRGWRLAIELPAAISPYMTPKGSVCVDGVSLTIAGFEPAAARLEVALIPATLERTTLAALAPGDGVNIEADALAKMVVQSLRVYGHPPERGA